MLKKILFFVSMSFGVALQSQAQDIVKDFFKSQNAKSQKASTKKNKQQKPNNQQDDIPYIRPNGEASENSTFDTDLVSDGLFIIKQQYIVRTEDGEEKTKNGNEYYGESYGLAVLTIDGYLVTPQVSEPWKYDNEYSPSTTAEPELTKSYITSVKEASFNLQSDYGSYNETDYSNIFSVSSDMDDKGFSLLSGGNTQRGILIWITSDENHTSFEISSESYESNLKSVEELSISLPDNTVGGIFVVPVRTNIGQLTYQLAGIVGNNNDGYILTPTVNNDEN